MTGILNLPGLNELGMKELDAEYHVKAEPAAISRLCPHCGELHRVQKHGSRSMFIRDLSTHGKTMMIHLDVPRLRDLVAYDSKGEPLPSKGSRKLWMGTSGTCTASGVLSTHRTASATVSGGMKRSS